MTALFVTVTYIVFHLFKQTFPSVEHLNFYKVSKQIQLQGTGALFMSLNKKTLKAPRALQ
jgi:hypothetical protein